VPAVGGTGTYTFTGTVDTCLGWSDGETTPLDEVITDCSGGFIGSNGTFTNFVCGTGTASGTATITGLEAGETAYITYTIEFKGGEGDLVVDPLSSTFGDDPIVDGHGKVVLTTPSGNPAECANGVPGFNVKGNATLVAFNPPGNP